MTRIDFYISPDPDPRARLRLACRLADKAYQNGHAVFVYAPRGEQARELDELLWTFRAGAFVPHGRLEEGSDAPVLISSQPPEGAGEVLVTLDEGVPPFFSRFQRVAELVGGDPAERRAGRERFRFYRERGYPLHTHELSG